VLAANNTSCSRLRRLLRRKDTDPNRALDNIQKLDPVGVARRHGLTVDCQTQVIAYPEKLTPAVVRINRCGVCATAHGSASSACAPTTRKLWQGLADRRPRGRPRSSLLHAQPCKKKP
jgi:hypothetical protein